jgi:hypothetical protein
MKGALIIGVRQEIAGTPQIAYLQKPVPATSDLLDLAESVHPAEVLRFAAPCEEKACRHFDGTDCRLATRIVQILPATVNTLPPCTIRSTCRWFRQEGHAACFRCPQIVTEVDHPSPELIRAATPE